MVNKQNLTKDLTQPKRNMMINADFEVYLQNQ